MADKEGARKTGKAYVMCTTPDVCLTNGCPVPYSIISYLDCAQKEVETVRMTGQCVLSMDSHLSTVIGDAPGSGGGLASGVNLGYCCPITHALTVRAQGHCLLFHSSEFWMNCPAPQGAGNTKGKLVYLEVDQATTLDPSGDLQGDTNPPVFPETVEELQSLVDADALVESPGPIPFPPTDPEKTGQPSAKSEKSTNSSDQRTSASEKVEVFYYDADKTSSGDAVFAAVALVKGRDPRTGMEVELLSGSIQLGLQTELQLRLARVGWSSDDGTKSGGLDTPSFKAAGGIHNPDGSTGLNVSLVGNIIGVEVSGTHDGSGASGGIGAGAEVGVEAFIGFGDSDSDGRPELSWKFAGKIIGALSIGQTMEFPIKIYTPKKK